MAISFDRYKDSLVSAWKDVVDDKSSTDWALFSYEGTTNNLKTISKGDGGIDEMREELNSGKIMYAFCKVFDPKTSLFKYVLVNWQGEGAPHHRKATSANHIRDVSNLFKGFHITLNARNEEEVDTDIIIEKLSKASAYSFKDRGELIKESGPVGTTYKRVIPEQEINSNERDKFWQKEEEEEKQRQEADRKQREEERRKLENEIKQREIEEAAQREAKIKERSKSISVLRDAERNELIRINATKLVDKTDDINQREQEEFERKDRSDLLRRQRSEEAQALISKRTINARAVFEQNTSAGQLLQRRVSHQPTSHTSAISPVKEEKVRWPPSQEKESVPKEDVESRASMFSQPLTTVECVEEKKNGLQTTSEESVTTQSPLTSVLANGTHSASLNGNVSEKLLTDNTEMARAQPYQEDMYTNSEVHLEYSEDLHLKAEALYDYQAADDTEISFDPGDVITRIDQIDAGWWQGMAPDGSYGLFPANYVQLLD